MNSQVTVTLSPDEFRGMIREEIEVLLKRVDPGDKLLTRAEVAVILKKSVQTVKKIEDRGIIKRATKSGQPRYRESEILLLKKH